MNRRQFLGYTGAAGLTFPSVLRSAIGSPNGRLQHASIGLGGMGMRDLERLLEDDRIEVVALCDVDSERLALAAGMAPKARQYADWRELLERESSRIDSVNVATPDHMHAAISLAAVRSGKHVYCQKPMCHDVTEVRVLTEAASRMGVVSQLGTQLASGLGERMTVKLLRDRVIGEVKHAYLFENRANAVERYRLAGPRPKQGQKSPTNLNWDLYLGNAPFREFAPDIYHRVKWRAWQDFGTGWLGDMGCHIFSPLWRGLGLQAPKTVQAVVQQSWKTAPARFADTWPQGEHVTWVFPGTEFTGGNELTVEWLDGMWYPPNEVQAILNRPGRFPAQGLVIVGSEGSIVMPHTAKPLLFPRDKFKDFPITEPEPANHYRGFIDACLGKKAAIAGFDVTGPMTEAVLLGTVAIRVPDTPLHWNSESMIFANHPAANSLLKRKYRNGWQVDGLG